MRISTGQIFRSGLESINQQQAQLNRVQLQLASGKRILTPSDDPGGAVQGLQFRQALARLDQFERNGSLAEMRLRQQEVVLGQVGDGLQRVRELAIQANNATQTPATRRAIAGEIRQQLAELYDLANARDSNGEYIFAGFASLDRPFTPTPAGAAYNGGDQSREIALSDERRIRIGDPGNAVFMGIPEGNGRFVVRENGTNTGTGVVQEATVRAAGEWDGQPRTIRFLTPDSWQALDPDDNVVGSGSYQPGGTLLFEGLAIRLGGSPAAGDRFDLDPASDTDLFGVFAGLAAALEAPVAGAADQARQYGAVGRALNDLDQALGHLMEVRATVGARLGSIDSQAELRAAEKLELQRTLSDLEDLDYAEAISRFNLRMAGLQAAQQSYATLARFSLFDFLR